jgi:hypothetical protein
MDIQALTMRCEKGLNKAGVKEWVTIRQDDLRDLLELVGDSRGRRATAAYDEGLHASKVLETFGPLFEELS